MPRIFQLSRRVGELRDRLASGHLGQLGLDSHDSQISGLNCGRSLPAGQSFLRPKAYAIRDSLHLRSRICPWQTASRLDLYQTQLRRFDHRFGTIGHVQFSKNVAQVALYRSGGDVQLLANATI